MTTTFDTTLPAIPVLNSEGPCACCGEEKSLRPMRRPINPQLDDQQLLLLTDEYGEEYAKIYHKESHTYANTMECEHCRPLSDSDYFMLITVREDR